MTNLFKRLSLPVKLILIGIVPFVFFVILSIQLYNERSQKVKLLDSYINRMKRSADLSMLITNLQQERKFSFDYSLSKSMQDQLRRQRPLTDTTIKKMANYDETLEEFYSYTFLDQLSNVRNAVDSGFLQPGTVIDYYSTTIFRLNTLNTLPTGSIVYVKPVYKDLVAQKLLSEMITYLGIITANIYNASYTHQYISEILVGTAGTYRVYKTYETEFLLKSSPDAISSYNAIKTDQPFAQTANYIDKAFKTFSIDSISAYEWESISTTAINQLQEFQQKLLHRVEEGVKEIYQNEQTAKRRTLLFLVFSLVFVIAIIFYTIYSITKTLKELEGDAQRISLGASGRSIPPGSNDVIAGLANSISAIGKNNKQLADAAQAIGKGQFDVSVEPRSAEDILGNAIVDMKASLQKNTEELRSSNAELERFAYIASHDLQEPLRMVSSFLNLLEEEMGEKLDQAGREYIHFAVDGASRMKILVNDLLLYSRVGTNKEEFTYIDIKEVIDYVLRVLNENIRKSNAVVTVRSLPSVKANRTLLGQLFMNLIGNSLKYHSEKRPEIEIGSTEEKDRYVFYVKDNGIGINSKFFDKIFIIFQRLHSKGEHPGTGIGLAICKKIVEVHKGKIWLESEEGKGSIFYFSIPKSNMQAGI